MSITYSPATNSKTIKLGGGYTLPNTKSLDGYVMAINNTTRTMDFVPNGGGAGGGDVSSSTSLTDDNEVTVFNATSGKIIKNSGIISTTLVQQTVSQTLTNKNLTDPTNNIVCKGLHTSTNIVDVSSAPAPLINQHLVATSSTSAEWKDSPELTYKYVVNTATYTTIQAAIDQAVIDGYHEFNPVTILVTNGSYNETITLANGISLKGTSANSVFITGTLTFTGTESGGLSIEDISFTNGGPITQFTINSPSTNQITLSKCNFKCLNAASTCLSILFSGIVNITLCDFIDTFAGTLLSIEDPSTVFINTCNIGYAGIASFTKGSAQLTTISNCIIRALNVWSNGPLTVISSSFKDGSVTTSGSCKPTFNFCVMIPIQFEIKDTSFVVINGGKCISPTNTYLVNLQSAGSNLLMINSNLGSDGTYVVIGLGTFLKHNVVFGVSSNIDPLVTVVRYHDVITDDSYTTKGQLLTATGLSSPVLLNAGVDGAFLKSNSLTSNGLEWALPSGLNKFSVRNTALSTDTFNNTDYVLNATIVSTISLPLMSASNLGVSYILTSQSSGGDVTLITSGSNIISNDGDYTSVILNYRDSIKIINTGFFWLVQ